MFDAYNYGQANIDQCLDQALPVVRVRQIRGFKKVSEPQPHRPSAVPVAVFDGDPRESPIGYVYPIGDEEFYVPNAVRQPNGRTTKKLDVRIENAEKVVRPEKSGARNNPFLACVEPEVLASMDFKTKQLSEMERTRNISSQTRDTLRVLVLASETPPHVRCKIAARP